ncbi:hypothetical protein BU25DRAFT_368965 [Macroventuria anomochaeta]|uniref:Uncharacterized protein n=1 Tax=Macroventuria anomochaeta TaxID=301207 RepID=A0ACB6RYY9_9PLEO|nr:uncharacterized protein BU25DRAFT_368965 [Macroventuria anomochaeta]KAF2627195.1 hypothetical protein BU25DRAFT_368965 [Macroventuria anomochaeta]
MDPHDLPTQCGWPVNTTDPTTFDAADFAHSWMSLPDLPFETTTEPPDKTFAGFAGIQEQGDHCNGLDQPLAKRRKPKATTLRDIDWEPHKSRILELYSHQKLGLQTVQQIIWAEKGFHAELRQYETVIEKWKLGKYIKLREMASIVRKVQQRKLIDIDQGDLTFKVRGKRVETERIKRWMRAHGVPEDELYVPSPPAPTPSDVECQTTSERSTPVQSPASLASFFFDEDPQPSATSPWRLGIDSNDGDAEQPPMVDSRSYDYCMAGCALHERIQVIMNPHRKLDDGSAKTLTARGCIYQAILSVRMDDDGEVARLGDALNDTLCEVSNALFSFYQARYVLEPRLDQTLTELLCHGDVLKNLGDWLQKMQKAFRDIEQGFREGWDLQICFCDAVRRLRMVQWWSQEMEIKTLEKIESLRTVDQSRTIESLHAVDLPRTIEPMNWIA